MAQQIPKDFIQHLLDDLDIVSIVAERIHLKKQGSGYTACCPFHEEKTPSFHVNPQKQFYYCFGCGAGGDVISFIKEYDHLSFIESVEKLAQRCGKTVPSESNTDLTKPVHYAVLQMAAKLFSAHLKKEVKAIDYLKSRGINGHMAKLFALGYIGNDANQLLKPCLAQYGIRDHKVVGLLTEKGRPYFYGERLMFPIRDSRGRVVGFGARSLGAAKPKYINSPATIIFNKKNTLYGLYEVLQKNRKIERLIVVEGYMDVIALMQHGVAGAVAPLGTACTTQHIQLLLRYSKQIVFAFDGDQAGQKAAWRALENALPLVGAGIKFQFLLMQEGHDPDSYLQLYGGSAFIEALEHAQDFASYFFSYLKTQYWSNDLSDQATFMKHAQHYINQIAPGIFKQMMVAEFKRISDIDYSDHSPKIKLKRPKFNANLKQALLHPAYQAIVLLLAEPGLLQDRFYCSRLLEGADLLNKIINLISVKKGLTCAKIIDFFEGDERSKLIKLASWDPPVSQDQVREDQWRAVLKRIKLESITVSINCLIEKSRVCELSEEERNNLNTLIKNKSLLDYH